MHGAYWAYELIRKERTKLTDGRSEVRCVLAEGLDGRGQSLNLHRIFARIWILTRNLTGRVSKSRTSSARTPLNTLFLVLRSSYALFMELKRT